MRHLLGLVLLAFWICLGWTVSPVQAQSPKAGPPTVQEQTLQQQAAQRATPGLAAQVAAADKATTLQPAWYPLPPEHEEYLNKILRYWEWQAGQVQRYKCDFTRWEYDLRQNPEVATTIKRGKVQYEAPDKGMFQVEKVWDLSFQQQGDVRVPALKKDGTPEYKQRQEVFDDHWICDGQYVFEFSERNKLIFKRPLPPEMRGKQIADGPLPFLFGAKVETIKQRYWIRVMLPPPKEGTFCLECLPKARAQAADYRAILVYIDDQEFLPAGLEIYDKGGGRHTYEFANREKNWNMLPQMLIPWRKAFFEPTPPANWKIVEEPMQGPAPAAVPPAAPTRQAARPGTGAPAGAGAPTAGPPSPTVPAQRR